MVERDQEKLLFVQNTRLSIYEVVFGLVKRKRNESWLMTLLFMVYKCSKNIIEKSLVSFEIQPSLLLHFVMGNYIVTRKGAK